jgi:hypothetical protein
VGGEGGVIAGLIGLLRTGEDGEQGGKKKATIALQQLALEEVPRAAIRDAGGKDALATLVQHGEAYQQVC